MVRLADRAEGAWVPPVVMTVATTGEGVDEVVEEIGRHHEHLEASGGLRRRRLARTRREIEAIALATVRSRFGDVSADRRLDDLAGSVLAGESDPFAAADVLVEQI